MPRDFARGTNGPRFEIPLSPQDETETTYSPSGNSSANSLSTCSPGIVFTRPERISSTRRLISSSQAASTPSSAGSSSRLSTKRSISKPRSCVERLRAFSSNSETCGVICAITTPLFAPSYTRTQTIDNKSPFSFQSLTSAQSPIQPLNPVFLPFVGIMVLILFPSHRIATDNSQGNVYKPGSYKPGSTSGENSNCLLESQVPGQVKACHQAEASPGNQRFKRRARSQELKRTCASRLST